MPKTNETIWNVIMFKTKENKYKCHNMDLVHLTASLPMKFPSTNQYGFSPISKNHLDFVISWITNCEMCGQSLWVHIELYVFDSSPLNGFTDQCLAWVQLCTWMKNINRYIQVKFIPKPFELLLNLFSLTWSFISLSYRLKIQ